jgi:glycosyltransferase involved in cell wall biosynthesis
MAVTGPAMKSVYECYRWLIQVLIFMQSLVSIVIPTYRRAHLIGRAVQSVLAQSFEDWELFVVNDGPEDGTKDVVNSFHDSRIRYLQHPSNLGGSAARNTGVRSANGSYVAFLDSDDEWLSAKLEKQIAVVSAVDGTVPTVSCGCTLIGDDGNRAELVPSYSALNHEQVLRLESLFVMTSSSLVCNRDALLEIGGFDETLPAFQDCELCVRLSKLSPLLCVQESLVIIHNTSSIDRIGSDVNRIVAGIDLCLKKHSEIISRDRMALANWLTYAGDRCFQGRQFEKGRAYYLLVWKQGHLGLNRIAHSLLSFWPRLYTIVFDVWRRLFWRAHDVYLSFVQRRT